MSMSCRSFPGLIPFTASPLVFMWFPSFQTGSGVMHTSISYFACCAHTIQGPIQCEFHFLLVSACTVGVTATLSFLAGSLDGIAVSVSLLLGQGVYVHIVVHLPPFSLCSGSIWWHASSIHHSCGTQQKMASMDVEQSLPNKFGSVLVRSACTLWCTVCTGCGKEVSPCEWVSRV